MFLVGPSRRGRFVIARRGYVVRLAGEWRGRYILRGTLEGHDDFVVVLLNSLVDWKVCKEVEHLWKRTCVKKLNICGSGGV